MDLWQQLLHSFPLSLPWFFKHSNPPSILWRKNEEANYIEQLSHRQQQNKHKFIACVRYFFTIFKRKMYFFIISNEMHWKEIKLSVVFSSYRFMNIHSRLSYQALPAFLKLLVLKNNCMCNRDNAHDIDIFPDKKITKRNEPTNQAKTKTNIAKGLKTYSNGSKNYLTT